MDKIIFSFFLHIEPQEQPKPQEPEQPKPVKKLEPTPDPMVNSIDDQINLLEIKERLILLRQAKEKNKTDLYYQ